MTKEIRKELIEAKKLYQSKKYQEALDIYEKHYLANPEVFNQWDKIFYSWSIYQLKIKDQNDETELFESVELVTELIKQEDLNKRPVCAYTLSVFKALNYLYSNNDYEYLLYWLDKLNPDLLDTKQKEFNGRKYPSNREKYYNYYSKALIECGDIEECIEVSKKALDSLTEFTNDSDVWYNWRIAKCLKDLDKNEEALSYLKEVSKVKRDWFVSKEIAENYFMLNDVDNACEYISKAVLTNDPASIKVNLYYLIYQILKDSNLDWALKHAELFVALKLDSDSQIPSEIEELLIEEEKLDKYQLEKEIKAYWSEYKFKDQELQYGTITKVFEDRNFGFITSTDDESIFFRKYEFKDDRSKLREGQFVSFYTEKSFDKSKNRESINAVNVRLGD